MIKFLLIGFLPALALAQLPPSAIAPLVTSAQGGSFSALQPDGKILFNNATQRLNADGSLDASYVRSGPSSSETDTDFAVNSRNQLFLIREENPSETLTLREFNPDGSSGPVQLNLGSSGAGEVYFRLQSDDKILVWSRAGELRVGGSSGFMARLNADGSLDSTFDVGFGPEYSVGSPNSGQIEAVSLQSDGKVLAVGLFSGWDNQAAPGGVVRLNANGTVDSTFLAGLPSAHYAENVAARPDGKVVVFYSQDGLVLLNADGSVAANLGQLTNGSADVYAMAVQSDSKVIVGGGFTLFGGTPVDNLIRLNLDGSLDPTFHPGTVLANFPGREDVTALAIQPDGKVFGSWGLLRLSADGSVDPNFNPTAAPSPANMLAVLKTPDGRTFLAGQFVRVNGIARLGLAAVRADGTADPGFAPTQGLQWNSLNANQTSLTAKLAVGADGSVTVAGTFTAAGIAARSGVARFLADGTLDPSINPSFNAGGVVTAVAVLPDGRIVIGGNFTSVNGQARANLAALTTAGTLDPLIGAISVNGTVATIAVRPVGGFWIGGNFTAVGSSRSDGIAAFNADGSVDPTFTPAASLIPVTALAAEPDGTVLELAGGGATRLSATGNSLSSLVLPLAPAITTFDGVLSQFPTAAAIAVDGEGRTYVAITETTMVGSPRFPIQVPSYYVARYQPGSTGADAAFSLSGVQFGSAIQSLSGGSDGSLAVAGVTALASMPVIDGLVLVAPPSVTAASSSASASVGRSVTLTATLSEPIAGTTYQWLKNGLPIAGATGSTYTIPATVAIDAGSYQVVTTNSDGQLVSAVLPVGVNLAPGETYLTNWLSASTLPSGTQYTSVAYDGVNFVAVGSDGSLLRSSDAISWAALSAAPGRLNSLIYVGAPYGFLGVGDNGAVLSLAGPSYSPLTQISGVTSLLTGIATGGGRMVAVGFGGVAIASPFAVPAWAKETTGVTTNLNAVAYGHGTFVAVGASATIVTSSDGLTWTSRSLGAAADLFSVAYGPAGFVAIGDFGAAGAIFTSPDGVTWTAQKSPTNQLLIRVVYANGTFVAVGAPGLIVTSTDGGFTWTAASTGTTSTLEGIAFGANGFVAVGNQGVAVKSAAAVAQLINLSARGFAGAGASNLVVGFTTSSPTGSGTQQVLLRGIGPALAPFGVAGVLPNPQLTLFGGNSVPMATDIGWNNSTAIAAAAAQVYAFALPPDSLDSALLQSLAPGAYTAQVGSPSATGNAMAEIYDASYGTSPVRLINLSFRAPAGTGSSVLIAGFVISGTTAETLLIRGVGPGLTQFGLTGVLAQPQLTLYDSTSTAIATNHTWGGTTALQQAFTSTGAFTLPVDSTDAALVVTLAPGSYTAQVTGPAGSSGIALVEVYEFLQP